MIATMELFFALGVAMYQMDIILPRKIRFSQDRIYGGSLEINYATDQDFSCSS